MSFCCPVHGYYHPVPGATLAMCPQCSAPVGLTMHTAADYETHIRPHIAALEAQRDRLREAITLAHGLIETASSRHRILQARDVLAAALNQQEPRGRINPRINPSGENDGGERMTRSEPSSGYAIRRTRADEWGQWLVVRDGYPNDIRGHFLTQWGARRAARRWARQNARAKESVRVKSEEQQR